MIRSDIGPASVFLSGLLVQAGTQAPDLVARGCVEADTALDFLCLKHDIPPSIPNHSQLNP